MTDAPFTNDVYEQIRAGARRSATLIVPWLHAHHRPGFVVDVGCGEGWFAAEFARLGAMVYGVDFVRPDAFAAGVPFVEADLAEPYSIPRQFQHADLALCLEVAEHLPEHRGPSLIDELCELSRRMVVFSAAVPGQGGHGHVNEQPASYWAELFAAHGYWPDLTLRDAIWNDDAIEPWYRQNLIVYSPDSPPARVLDVVHPEIFRWRVEDSHELRRRIQAEGSR